MSLSKLLRDDLLQCIVGKLACPGLSAEEALEILRRVAKTNTTLRRVVFTLVAVERISTVPTLRLCAKYCRKRSPELHWHHVYVSSPGYETVLGQVQSRATKLHFGDNVSIVSIESMHYEQKICSFCRAWRLVSIKDFLLFFKKCVFECGFDETHVLQRQEWRSEDGSCFTWLVALYTNDKFVNGRHWSENLREEWDRDLLTRLRDETRALNITYQTLGCEQYILHFADAAGNPDPDEFVFRTRHYM